MAADEQMSEAISYRIDDEVHLLDVRLFGVYGLATGSIRSYSDNTIAAKRMARSVTKLREMADRLEKLHGNLVMTREVA